MNNCVKHNNDDINKLFKQACDLYEEKSYDESLNILFHLVESHKDEISYSETLFYISGCLIFKDKITDGLHYLIEAERGIKVEENELLFLEIMDYMGYCYKTLKNFKKGLTSFKRGEKYLHLWENNDYINRKFWYLIAKADCYLGLNNHESALEEFRKQESILSSIQNEEDRKMFSSIIYFNITRELFFFKKNTDSYDILSKVNYQYLNDAYKQAYFMVNINLNICLFKYSNVIDNYLIYEKIGILDNNKAHIYNWVGTAYYYINNIREAKRYFKKSLKYDDDVKWAHKNAREYLQKYCFTEKKYRILNWSKHFLQPLL